MARDLAFFSGTNTMKQNGFEFLLGAGFLAVAFLAGAAVAEDELPMDPAIQSLLAEHDKALKDQDLAAVVATFVPGSDTVLLGTGPGERWLGQQEIKAAYEHFFADYDRGTLSIDCGSRASGRRGNLAWLAASCRFTDALGNRKRAYEVNITAVAEKQDSAWRFRAFHFSNLTGGGAARQAAGNGNQ
jgi:uncharacterized protein (TIGR02246 family)